MLLVAPKRKRRSAGVVYKTRLFYDPARSTQEFDDVFRSARRVERKYAVLLRGRVQEIVTQGLYTTGAHLLAVLDAMPAPGDRTKEQSERISAAAASAKKETRQIEDYASIVAMKSALVRYLSGIFLGAVAVALGVYAAAAGRAAGRRSAFVDHRCGVRGDRVRARDRRAAADRDLAHG